jgi:hypothetical protein
MQSPASTPSTAVVGDVTWNWTWNGGTPPGLQMQICDVQRCTTITSGFPSGTTSAFAGDPGVNTWQIKFEAKTSTTKVFSPYYYGGTDQLNVATTY